MMMTPERWKQVSRLYEAARARPLNERAAFVADECGSDATLRGEVQSLLDQPTSPPRLEGLTASVVVQAIGEVSGSPLTGRRFGDYLVGERIDSGGMCDVYRARDTRLQRDVAIKVLQPAFADDPDRLARFEREARLLAALDHPHIGTIYGVEESDPSTGSGQAVIALVLALIEGETLTERLARGALPMTEALEYARQIVDALEAAHGRNIIHRDLKPSNIKITPSGVAKVLDFGLAKELSRSPDLKASPASALGGTQEGVILGTAAYMSPEQARGRPVDKRTDIWAFGCVLYELLTGQRAFPGDTVSDTIAAVLERDPDWGKLPADTPEGIRRLLRRCLRKDKEHRLRDIGDVRLEIEESRSRADEGEHKPQRPRTSRKALAGAVVASLLLLIAVAAYVMRPRQAADMLRFEIDLPNGRTDLGSAISPDGQSLVFVGASTTGDDVLWVRRMDTLEATPLSGTEGAYSPFWSPDSGSIAFFALGKLKRVPATGGAVQTLCDVLSPAVVPAGAWAPDDSIIFAQSFGPLHKVSALGGEVVPVTVVNEARREFGHYNPVVLPDGEHFAYEVGAVPERLGIHVGSLRSADVRQLSPKSLIPFSVTPDGMLLALEQGVLKAQKLDLRRLTVIDEGVPLLNGVRAFTVSANGRLAYEPASQARKQLTWFNRAGERLATVGRPGAYDAPVLSPDETKVAVGRDGDIWVLDLVRGGETRLTFDPAAENWPLWSPDGREILFDRVGSLIRKPSSGAGMEEVLFEGGATPFGMSADGRFVTYMAWGRDTLGDLYVLPLLGERKPQPFLRNKFQEAENQLSPDGKWMTYDSSESGRYEVYVQAFPSTLERWQISTTGGSQPTWRSDARELFYVSSERQLMAVDIETTPHFRAGIPRALFRLAAPIGPVRNSYAPSRNGDRFLVNSYAEDTASTVVILLNWRLPD